MHSIPPNNTMMPKRTDDETVSMKHGDRPWWTHASDKVRLGPQKGVILDRSDPQRSPEFRGHHLDLEEKIHISVRRWFGNTQTVNKHCDISSLRKSICTGLTFSLLCFIICCTRTGTYVHGTFLIITPARSKPQTQIFLLIMTSENQLQMLSPF